MRVLMNKVPVIVQLIMLVANFVNVLQIFPVITRHALFMFPRGLERKLSFNDSAVYKGAWLVLSKEIFKLQSSCSQLKGMT